MGAYRILYRIFPGLGRGIFISAEPAKRAFVLPSVAASTRGKLGEAFQNHTAASVTVSSKKIAWQALSKKSPCCWKRQNKVEILQKTAGSVPCIYKSPVLYCV